MGTHSKRRSDDNHKSGWLGFVRGNTFIKWRESINRTHWAICTPADALSCFYATGIDNLVIGNYLVNK